MEKPLPRGESSQRQHLPLKRTNSHPPPKRSNFHTFLRREILFLRFIFFHEPSKDFVLFFFTFNYLFTGRPLSRALSLLKTTTPHPTGKNSRKIPHRDYNLRTKCHKFTHDAHLATQKKSHTLFPLKRNERPACGKKLSSKEIASTLTGVRTQTERGIVPAGATVRGFAKSRTARKDIGRSEGFGKSRGNIWASDERGMRKRFL